ncbi:Lysozyme RrrD [Halomonadaceae bacterium LMG 33818]|uniref:lysozyme n=1 Tax=Cernens ardua TaxID=3402176 RepID=UPI003EDC7DD8
MGYRPSKKTGIAGAVIAGGIAIATPLINHFEGHRKMAYLDAVGIPTICAGITAGVHLGDVATDQQCDAKVAQELQVRAKQVSGVLNPSTPMSKSRFAAFLDFQYNVGQGAFQRSSIVRKFNAGDVTGACNALLLYDKAGGRVLNGLKARREYERKLCLMNNP